MFTRRTLRTVVLALVPTLVAACSGEDAGPPGQPEAPGAEAATDGTLAFVSTLGSDTVTVETFTRTADRIEGELIERNPRTQRIRYVAELAQDGSVRRMEVEASTPPENPDGPATRRWTVEVGPDSATVTREGGENAGTSVVPVGERPIPAFERAVLAAVVMDQAIRQARAGGALMAPHPVELIQPGSPQPAENAVSPHAGDTVAFSFFGLPMYAWTEGGALAGVSGRETTMKVETRRAASLDMDALASDWAARDAMGEGLGVPSPAATTTASVGGVGVEIRYSQPARRGREIWGGLVPYGEVWRTGANAATHLTVDGDVTIGDLEVPAGTYTLWSTFTDDSAELIVNRQTDQWGTQYDPDQDLGRVSMTRTELDQPVERFTILVQDGMLTLEWDRTRFSVPISAG